MPAKDIYHDAVKNALIKDGWTITADPNTARLRKIVGWVEALRNPTDFHDPETRKLTEFAIA
jgi:XisH protein